MGTRSVVEVLGGRVPLAGEELARRAYEFTLHPGHNPVKAIMDSSGSVQDTPPMLGIFNDIPWYHFRESEAHAWARAGLSWVINDAEHRQWEGWYGRDQNTALLRLGLVPVQRLHREAVSLHGDAYQLGARATMRPYGTTYEEAVRYLRAVSFPNPGAATPDDRGGYPVRDAERALAFTPAALLAAESETQAWVQFETGEYLLDRELRDRILDLMAAQGRNKACGFVGPFDAILRVGPIPELSEAIHEFFREASARGVYSGAFFGSADDPARIEEAVVEAVRNGCRLIGVDALTSDLVYRGISSVVEPYFRAFARCGF